MMNTPRKIIILSQSVPVSRITNLVSEGSDCFGVYLPGGPTINLDRDMGPERIKSTLMHEIVHAINDLSGIARMFDNHDTEETFVNRISPILLAWLRENRNVVSYLQERS